MGGAKPLMANAVCGPTPGIVCSRRAVSFVPARPRALAVLASFRAVCSDICSSRSWHSYRQLEAEHDHLTSDEAIEEGIIMKEYTFTEAGRRFG
jgi:hypothetical protein